jgi:hypothetical protein
MTTKSVSLAPRDTLGCNLARRGAGLLQVGLHKVRFTLNGAAKGAYSIFGGHEVGIGFSGSCDDDGASLEATAPAGKRGFRLTADLKLVRRA